MPETVDIRRRLVRKWVMFAALVVGVMGYPAKARADVCHLAMYGSTCPDFGAQNPIYRTTYAQPPASGRIDAFLRVPRNPEPSDKAGSVGKAGHNQVLLSKVPFVNADGTPCAGDRAGCRSEFRLDLGKEPEPDETDKKAWLPFDQLEAWLSPTGQLTRNESDVRTTNGLTAVYSLDAGAADNYLKLDYSVQPGSDSGQMIMFLPNSLFSDVSPISLYSQAGTWIPGDCVGGCSSSESFEEWWMKGFNVTSLIGSVALQTAVPEPATLVLIGAGLAVMGTALRKRKP